MLQRFHGSSPARSIDPDRAYGGPVNDKPDDVLVRINEAMVVGQRGDRDAARTAFLAIWDEVGDDGDPLHRCGVAQAMADVQDDPHDELRWHLLAADALGELTDERLAAAGMIGPVRRLEPSLHLNLADVYQRLDDPAQALAHVQAARESVDALDDDVYRRLIVEALDRVEETVSAEVSE